MFSIVHLVLCLLKSLVSKMLTEFELSDTLFQFFFVFFTNAPIIGVLLKPDHRFRCFYQYTHQCAVKMLCKRKHSSNRSVRF